MNRFQMKSAMCICIATLIVLISCQSDKKPDNALLFSKSNLVAWCIVPFDSVERTPEERAAMSGTAADAKVILEGNLKGLQSLLKEMGDESALATY